MATLRAFGNGNDVNDDASDDNDDDDDSDDDDNDDDDDVDDDDDECKTLVQCSCTPGWRGVYCDTPCPVGRFHHH